MRLQSQLLPAVTLLLTACNMFGTAEEEAAPAPAPAPEPVAVAEPAPAPKVVSNPAPRSEDPAVQRVQRRAGQRDVLARKFIAEGDAQVENAEFEGALISFASAHEVDPGNQEARARMLKVEALMGKTYAVAADALSDEVEREIVRRAQARISADRAATLGDNALRAGRYDEAVAQYREAELILRYHPLIADSSLIVL